jgi:hypothetical protein
MEQVHREALASSSETRIKKNPGAPDCNSEDVVDRDLSCRGRGCCRLVFPFETWSSSSSSVGREVLSKKRSAVSVRGE